MAPEGPQGTNWEAEEKILRENFYIVDVLNSQNIMAAFYFTTKEKLCLIQFSTMVNDLASWAQAKCDLANICSFRKQEDQYVGT